MPKHLTPQEDKIICTWLLRGALHKDHFSKITAWLAFIPYFWKHSCFLRLPLLPLFFLPSLSPPLSSLSCFSFHMLVLFFLIFPLCKKWKAENRMSEEGRKAGGKSSDCTSVKSLRLFSSLCTDSYGYNTAPNPIHIHHTLQTKHYNAKCSLGPLQNYTLCGVFLQHDQRDKHWSVRGSCIKKTPFKSHSDVQVIWKAKLGPCMLFELVISRAHCSVTGEAKPGELSVCPSLSLLASGRPLRNPFSHIKCTKRMEVRGVWAGVDLAFFSPCLFVDCIFHGGPSVRGSRQSWLGWHDSTFRPNPHVVLHTVVVMMELERGTYWKRERDWEG